MRITPSLKFSLERLLDSHTLFGGREAELGRLDEFIEHRSSGYIFVTARSGFGKTALLANWVRTFPRKNQTVCYHFISRIYGKTAEEDFSLRSLCQQLTACQDLRGSLPASASDLRALYPHLLAIPAPAGQKLIVVLDGLDEAQGWIGEDLFPLTLPEGVFIVFSAREIAGRDWPDHLGIPEGPVDILELTTLGPAQISRLLQAAGGEATQWFDNDRFVTMMYEKSGGDPFYLRYLVEDIRKKAIRTVEQLENQPSELKGYLDRWWQEVSEAVSERAVSDLLGYLLVAKGRLSRDDLTEISQEDALRGAVFERTITQLRRYVIGDEAVGYMFCHPRFRDYVAQERIKEREQQPYLRRLLAYCADWREHKREYALTYYAAHLVDAGRFDDLLQLLGPAWFRAKWNHFGSYSAVIRDLDIASIAAYERKPPDYAHVASLAVARQTARELMLNFPTALLIAWIRLGEVDRVLELLGGLSTVKGRATEAFTAVAKELLALKAKERKPAETIDLAQVAAELVGQAAGMLAVIRSSSGQLEAVAAITDLLEDGKGLSKAQREQLVEQVLEYAQTVREPTLHASTLGLMASALATSESSRDKARSLVAHARAVIEKIDYLPDVLMATAYLLPALRILDPGSVIHTVRSAYGADDPFKASSLGKNPLGVLLMKWAPKETSDRQGALQSLREIGELSVNRDEPAGYIAGYVAEYLCALQQGGEAVDLVENLWRREPIEGARALHGAFRPLYHFDPDGAKTRLEQSHEFTDHAHYDLVINRGLFTCSQAACLAVTGQWDSAIRLLETIRHRERVDGIHRCLNIATEAFADDTAGLIAITDRLISLIHDAEADEQISVFSTAAQELVPYDLSSAKGYLNSAVGLSLCRLPEGDTDKLRRLLAIAQHEAGDYIAASASIDAMKWVHLAVETYSGLIEKIPEDNENALEGYVNGMLRLLDDDKEHTLFNQTLSNLFAASRHLAGKHDGMARRLCDNAVDKIKNLTDLNDQFHCHALNAATRYLIDKAQGLEELFRVVAGARYALNEGYDIRVQAIVDLYGQLAVVALPPEKGRRLLEDLRPIHEFFPELDDRISLETAYAVSLASFDGAEALGLLNSQLPTIAEIGTLPPPAPHILRMLSEFMGEKVGPRYLQARAANALGRGIVAVSDRYPREAAELMHALLARIAAIESTRDLAQALVELFKNCSKGPAELQPYLIPVYKAAIESAQGIPEPELVSFVFARAIEAYCNIGNIEEAQRVADLLVDAEAKSSAESMIGLTKERMEIGELSVLEQAFVADRDETLAYIVLYNTHVKQTAGKILEELASEMANDQIKWERSRLIGEWARLMILPAGELYGVEGIASLIHAIEAADQCFLDAAAMIAEQ